MSSNLIRWVAIIVAVIAIFIIANAYRVNRTTPKPAATVAPKYTYGTVVDEKLIVEKGGYRHFRFDLNRRTKLAGRYITERRASNVGLLILDDDNFKKFVAGEEFKIEVRTGNIPGGQVDRMMEPGTYYLVFDNRHEPEFDRVVEASFAVD